MAAARKATDKPGILDRWYLMVSSLGDWVVQGFDEISLRVGAVVTGDQLDGIPISRPIAPPSDFRFRARIAPLGVSMAPSFSVASSESSDAGIFTTSLAFRFNTKSSRLTRTHEPPREGRSDA